MHEMSLIKLTPENLDSLYQMRLERKQKASANKNKKLSSKSLKYDNSQKEVDSGSYSNYQHDYEEQNTDPYHFINNYVSEELHVPKDVIENN